MTTEQLPRPNLFDIPELMPGASPSAGPAQRTEFEQRCRKLHDEEATESTERAAVAAARRGATSVDELALMFPSLDPDLVRVIAADFPTPQHAIETLLQLVESASEPTEPPLPPKDLPLEDLDLFPSLTDKEGWQVVDQKQFDRDPDEELGSAWRDRAKSAASKPAPRSSNTSATVAPNQKRRPAKGYDANNAEVPVLESDYDFRQRRGQQRARNRAQFGRGGGKGIGRGRPGTGGCDKGDSGSDEEEEEDEGAQKQ